MNNVQKLTLGSAKLNNMRNDIKIVLGTIGAELDALPLPSTIELVVGELKWQAIRSRPVRIYCYAYVKEEKCNVDIYERDKEPALENVQRVHASLEPFLNHVLKEFPEIAKRLSPVFAAAEL